MQARLMSRYGSDAYKINLVYYLQSYELKQSLFPTLQGILVNLAVSENASN